MDLRYEPPNILSLFKSITFCLFKLFKGSLSVSIIIYTKRRNPVYNDTHDLTTFTDIVLS